ncbi:motility protein A [Lachnobacterium bovis]|uniref:Chemotaxis protein MotA n=1 Tax=Lachnobacterium bovis DSM 14045 TaxID=1122142 RepID=A0A1H3EXB4_9FIRM|nr:motility protein A [Lachnobacterium bovis]MBQ1802629.1 motility protein A [Lachnobacterium sp.]SDX83452.1 chemotaxis protein MotA [Lachnobacterium bovis DSM 14045]
MDIASLAGIVLGLVMVVFGIISSGGVAAFGNFIDVPSVIITIGGSLSSTLAANKLPDFINGLKGMGLIFKENTQDPGEIIKSIIDMSNVARKEGLLALEEAANNIEDPFLKKGIMLVVDGTDPELVRGILETDMMCLQERHKTTISFWDKWGEMGPAWGMIGTLVGLVNMLKNLSDSSTIGPSMAVALLTTLYGSLIANWITNPVASKLKVNDSLEVTMREVTVEGLLSIQAGENPRVIEEKLKSFLAPSQRDSVGASGGGGEE